MRHWKIAAACAALGGMSLAWAGQVPNPINADGTIVAGHFVLGNGAQRATDSGWSLVPMANGGCNAALTAAANDLLYSTSTSCSLLPTADNSILATNSAGAPSWTTALPAGIAVPSGDCPLPTFSTVGCVETATPVSHEWIHDIDTGGIPHLTQPAFSDISGIAAVGQGGTGGTTGSAAMTNFSGSYTVCQAAPDFALTGTTTKTQMNAAQCRIPANTLAVGSCVEVWMLFSWTNNADTKTIYWSLNTSNGTGGSAFFSATETTNASAVDEHSFCVTGASSEWGFAGGSSYGNSGNAIGTLSLSTASDMYVNFVGQDVTSGSDTLTLVAYWVRIQSTAGN